jgi:ribosomal protein S18 acetylase RimI-like enzyme
MAVVGQDSLAYDLLLRKSSQQKLGGQSIENASTEDPEQASACSIADVVGTIAPSKKEVMFLRSVRIHLDHTDTRMAGLICHTRKLSQFVFDEDCLNDITKKSNWKLTLLVTEDLSTLCGFLISKVVNGALSIAKLAVPPEFRGSGFGKLIMEDAIKIAKKQSNVYEVCLSSLATAVTFYQRLGFKAYTSYKIDTDKDVVEGQVYMQKKLRPRRS